MIVLDLTPEQWQTVEKGLPVPVKSPRQQECVIVQKEVFERMQKIVQLEQSDWFPRECGEDIPLSS
jgi:hypothetical protein